MHLKEIKQNSLYNQDIEDDTPLYFNERRILNIIFWPSFLCLVYSFVSYNASLFTLETITTASSSPLVQSTASLIETHQKDIIPVLWGLGIAMISYVLLYMDSAIPGVEPPSPFSPKNQRHVNQRKVHLNYTVPLFTGVCIWFLMHFSYKTI